MLFVLFMYIFAMIRVCNRSERKREKLEREIGILEVKPEISKDDPDKVIRCFAINYDPMGNHLMKVASKKNYTIDDDSFLTEDNLVEMFRERITYYYNILVQEDILRSNETVRFIAFAHHIYGFIAEVQVPYAPKVKEATFTGSLMDVNEQFKAVSFFSNFDTVFKAEVGEDDTYMSNLEYNKRRKEAQHE